jgi:hypothetical protein
MFLRACTGPKLLKTASTEKIDSVLDAAPEAAAEAAISGIGLEICESIENGFAL